jgi:hypothetical protein
MYLLRESTTSGCLIGNSLSDASPNCLPFGAHYTGGFVNRPDADAELLRDHFPRYSPAPQRCDAIDVYHDARSPELFTLPLRITKASAHSLLNQRTLELAGNSPS